MKFNKYFFSTECPVIITRAQWGSRPVNRSPNLRFHPAPFAVIHHTAGARCTTDAACEQQVRNIQNFHMNTNGWANIGYNFLIGDNGRVYEGRGWNQQGAHAPSYNNQAIGISFIGTFTSGLPSAAARTAAQQLISCGVSRGEIRSAYSLIGHRQGSATECPGNSLFNEIQRWPNFNRNPRPL